MAVINNYLYISCDHCGNSDFFKAMEYAENVGWEFDAVIGEERLDLCPKCSRAWGELVHDFLYENSKEANE